MTVKASLKNRLLYITIGLLPLYPVRFSVAGIPTNAFEVLAAVAVMAAIVTAWRNGSLREYFSLPRERTFRWGSFLLFLGIALSTALNPTLHALGILKSWFVLPLFVFLTARYVYGGRLEAPVNAYAISGFFVALIALGYALAGVFTFDGRLRAFFESPNHLAMYLAPALILISANLYNNSLRRWRFAVLAGCAVLSAALLMTRSHGALFAVVGAVALGWLMPRVSKNLRIAVIVIIVVIGAALPYAAVRIAPVLAESGLTRERSSLASRVMIWRAAIDIGKDHAAFGIGPGAFQDIYLEYQKNYPPYLEWAVPQPHNLYLAFWLQTGLTGLAGFLLLLVWFFKEQLSDSLAASHQSLNTVMLYILLHGAVDTLYWKNDLSVLFWLLLAAAGASAYGSGRLTDSR